MDSKFRLKKLATKIEKTSGHGGILEPIFQKFKDEVQETLRKEETKIADIFSHLGVREVEMTYDLELKDPFSFSVWVEISPLNSDQLRFLKANLKGFFSKKFRTTDIDILEEVDGIILDIGF
jgi:hypothetical protein